MTPENDSPPGAAPYSSGPLAMMKPTPAPMMAANQGPGWLDWVKQLFQGGGTMPQGQIAQQSQAQIPQQPVASTYRPQWP